MSERPFLDFFTQIMQKSISKHIVVIVRIYLLFSKAARQMETFKMIALHKEPNASF